jgi:hypothetical protein
MMSDTAATTTTGAGAKTVYTPSAVLDAEGEPYVSGYLSKEILDVLNGSERAAFIAKVDKWRRMALSQPEQETKTYPWMEASNIVTPIMAEKQNTIFAKLIAMFSSKRPFWSCESEDPTMTDAANAIARLMNLLAKGTFHLNIDKVNRTLFYDLVLLGAQMVKVPWLYEAWPVMVASSGSASAKKAMRVMHDGPAVVPVRMEDFIIRSYYDNVQRAPWVATRSWLTHADLLQRQADGIYANVDQVLDFYAKNLTKDRQDELLRRGFAPSSLGDVPEMRLYPVFEAYVFYDSDGDGIPEDIKVWIEVESGTILRSEMNTLGARDLCMLRYFQLPYQMMGVGIGHFIERLQDEADFLHNHRLDNLHFSLIPAWKRRRGSSTKKEITLHPGAIIDVDDVNDMMPLVTPDLTGSTYQSEALTRDYADRVSGAKSPMSGYADPTMKSGADVGSTLFLAEQGNSILNAIYDGIETDYNEIGQLVLMQLVANRDKVDLSMLSPEDQSLVQKVLALPLETLPTTFAFTVETTDQSRSEETKRQTLAQATALYSQYGQQAMSLATIVDNPQLPPTSLTKQLAQRLFVGATEFVREAFTMMKVEKLAALLPDTTAMQATLAAEDAQANAAANTGGNASAGPANGSGAAAAGMGGAGVQNGGGMVGGQIGSAGQPGGLGVVPEATQALKPFGG